jgi:hypothetical protein
VWLRRLLADLTKRKVQKVSLKIDNQAAISLCKNPVHHERCKHIDTQFHYIRECVEEGMIKVKHVNTNDQLAYILTKFLRKQNFIEMRKKVGVEDVKKGNKVIEVNVDGNLAAICVRVGLGSSTSLSRTRGAFGILHGGR